MQAALPELLKTKAGYVWAGRDYPAARVSLRSTGPEAFTIVDASSGTMLGVVEQERAYSTVHEGAIYLHLGESYRVRELDFTTRTAVVEPFRGDYYTQAKKETSTAIVEATRSERRLGVDLSFGRVVVTEQVVGYQKRSIQTQESIELVPLVLPQTEFETEAVWFLPEPWMLAMTLEALEWQKAGFDPELGLDKHFYDRAQTDLKAVQGLETLDYQVSRFDEMPMDQQDKLLADTLNDLDTETANANKLADAWRG